MLHRVKLAPARNEFQKKPLGRRRHLMSEPTGSANLVPLRLERSESAASLESFLAGAETQSKSKTTT